MTLAAPRSRQGKAFLALAILAALVAVMGALVWANDAQASPLPNTTLELDQNPDGPATIAPGTPVTYTATATLTAGITSGDTLTVEIDIPANLTNAALNCVSPASSDSDMAGGDATCNWDNAGPGTYIMTLSGTAGGNLPVPGAAVCSVVAVTEDDCDAFATGNEVEPAEDVNPTDTGLLTMGAGTTVVNATNFPGIAHTFVFNMLAGITCQSDSAEIGGLEDRSCTAADVTIGGTAGCTLTAGPIVSDPLLANPSTVTVTISGGTGIEGTCTVTLATYFLGPCEDCTGDDFDSGDVIATKTFSFAVAGGTLCHLDIPDAATEDAAGNTGGILYVGNLPANGCIQTDIDDAIGSFHGACIIGSGLTYAANGAQITWSITPVAGGPAPASVQGFAAEGGGEPCVMWGAGSTGTQQITATYAPGGLSPSVNFYWNMFCVAGGGCFDSEGAATTAGPLPLIKEWNTIDFTKIISSTGNVGDTLPANTLGLADWVARDCIDSVGLCGQANLDGTTKNIAGVLMPNGNVSATGATFIDYTMGSHDDAGGAYDGPVDGAQQTYTLVDPVGSDDGCGSVRLENPTTGIVIILQPGDSATVLSSDKGVGFQVLPNSTGDPVTTSPNSDCQPGECITVTIDTEEDNLFHSPPLFEANQETITVCFNVGPPTNKQPQLVWAGQRVVLEHDWGFIDADGVRTCPFDPNGEGPGPQGDGSFFVRYVKEAGNGALIDDLNSGAATGPDFMVVRVDGDGDSNTDPNANCISRVIYEAQDQGEQDIVAHVVQCAPIFFGGVGTNGFGGNVDPDTCSVVSEQVAFLLFYMKFEDITLNLIPAETTHDSTSSQESTVVNPPTGASSTTANVSANVLARAAVRGWVLADNCPARASAVGSNGEFIPANRCIFPDDWLFKAGGDASDARKNYDNYGGSSVGCTADVAGPYSSLDPIVFDSQGDRVVVCGDSMAPHADGGQRETNFPDGVIDANDAPMPSALIRFLLEGSGFLTGAVKDNPNDQFNVTHIPAEPWISPINADLSGYQWNSWGSGPKSGVYHYWTDFGDTGPEVLSCGGDSSGAFVPGVGDPDPCGDGSGVPTGGFLQSRVYSDEHGIAMTWINGDANLTFDDCDASTPTDNDHDIVLLNGFFCEDGDVVGDSTINALADYPDKRKHFAVLSEDATITWTWGGVKEITVEPGSSPQFNYVVFHVTDRDGFCGGSPSLHPVLGEVVQFRIDSDAGVIFPNVNGDSAAGPPVTVSADGKQATTHTFDTDVEPSVANGGLTVLPVQAAGECQAWIHVSESLLGPVNVIVTAFDPEGTVTFDTTGINPTPTPSPTPAPTPTPSPSPTPFTLNLKWGDSDCDGNVAPRDGQAILKHFLDQTELSQSQPCPAMGERVIVGGVEREWGDWDCNGAVAPRDGQAGLKFFLSQTALSQTAPCTAIGTAVGVQRIGP